MRGDRQAGADHRHDCREAVTVIRHAIIAAPGIKGIAGPQPAEAITVEHRQRQRRLFVGAVALSFGPDKPLLAQQLAYFAARFAGDDRQVQILTHQQLF
ncbi:hypothetical protein D3C85_1678910 [compost metagenome]